MSGLTPRPPLRRSRRSGRTSTSAAAATGHCRRRTTRRGRTRAGPHNHSCRAGSAFRLVPRAWAWAVLLTHRRGEGQSRASRASLVLRAAGAAPRSGAMPATSVCARQGLPVDWRGSCIPASGSHMIPAAKPPVQADRMERLVARMAQPHTIVFSSTLDEPAPRRPAERSAPTGCPWHDVRAMLRQVGLRPTRQRMALGWILFGKKRPTRRRSRSRWRRFTIP